MSKKTTKKKTVNLGEHPREEALANALAQIEKEYGKGAIMKLGDETKLNITHHAPQLALGLSGTCVHGLPQTTDRKSVV